MTVLAFDVYGTLLSTSSIAGQLAEHFGKQKADSVAMAWRKHQLEYTWRLNSMHQYQPFSQVTKSALYNALAENGESLNDAQIQDLMVAYDSLDTFPDVEPCLTGLGGRDDLHIVAFSNGTDAMVSASINKSPALADLSKHIKDIVTVEKAKRFKPDPATYHLLAQQVAGKDGTSMDMASIWLISGNPFDIVGANAVGMKTAWVDRNGAGWPDRLVAGDKGRPTEILTDLKQLADAIRKHSGST